MKKFCFAACIFACVLSCALAQKETDGLVYYQSFDNMKIDKEKVKERLANSITYQTIFQPAHSEGLRGKALDLTENVPFRIPLCLTEQECPSYDENGSFSIQVWVSTLPGAQQGTPIMSNKRTGTTTWTDLPLPDTRDSAGWSIGTRENGAWSWNISDGRYAYNYEPTAERQAINDGRWHQITISVDRERNEMWMFLDGRNVAIYQLREGRPLGSAATARKTVVGGAPFLLDSDNVQGEWHAFNGKVDQVKLWSRPVSAAEVRADYEKYFPSATNPPAARKPESLKVQIWNIWGGGHRLGRHVGVKRVAEVLKRENADIIGVIETYGSGAVLADSLGYYYYLIGRNLSILSRYPIENTIKLQASPWNAGGTLIDLGDNQKIAFFDIWLDWQPNTMSYREMNDKKAIKAYEEGEKKSRLAQIDAILKEIAPYTENSDKVPVITGGDFNSLSHLDVNKRTSLVRNGVVFDSPVSESMIRAGYTDSFRERHPDPLITPGNTWSPVRGNEPGLVASGDIPIERIDYLYYKGEKLTLYHSEALNHHPIFWPSDHGSVVSSFYLE